MLYDWPIWEELDVIVCLGGEAVVVAAAAALLIFSRIFSANGVSANFSPRRERRTLAAPLASLVLSRDLALVLAFSNSRLSVVHSWLCSIRFPLCSKAEEREEEEEEEEGDPRRWWRVLQRVDDLPVLKLFLEDRLSACVLLRGFLSDCPADLRFFVVVVVILLFVPIRLWMDLRGAGPLPNILSTTLSPTEASAPMARGMPMDFSRGRPLVIRAGGMDNPPRCITGSRVVLIWFWIPSFFPFPSSMGSMLRPARA